MLDYLVVGSGLFGSVFAHEMAKAGKQCLVLERRPHVGGNVYCEEKEGIRIHKYGAHIFHTSDKKVWDYVNQFVEFNNYVNSPVANYKGELYNLPFNMNTFAKMWGIVTPQQAAAKIAQQRKEAGITNPKNLEEQAISFIGTDIYTKLIKGYTEKQWGRSCTELPAFIIKRLPVRYTFDNNYCFSSSIFPHFRHSTSPLSSWEIPHFQQALSGYRFHNCVLPHKGMFHSVASSTSHQEMAVVSQSVNHGSGHLFIGEDAAPF